MASHGVSGTLKSLYLRNRNVENSLQEHRHVSFINFKSHLTFKGAVQSFDKIVYLKLT